MLCNVIVVKRTFFCVCSCYFILLNYLTPLRKVRPNIVLKVRVHVQTTLNGNRVVFPHSIGVFNFRAENVKILRVINYSSKPDKPFLKNLTL